MLDAFIIDRIRRERQERQDRESQRYPIRIEAPRPDREMDPRWDRREEEQQPERGVAIIDYSI